MTLAGYLEIGGVAGLYRGRAEAIYQNLDAEGEEVGSSNSSCAWLPWARGSKTPGGAFGVPRSQRRPATRGRWSTCLRNLWALQVADLRPRPGD